jgi:hypothetical protein
MLAMSGLDQIDMSELEGGFEDVAQLARGAMSPFQSLGLVFAYFAGADEAGAANVAAVQLVDGTQYLLVEHFEHPDSFIDIRARYRLGASNEAAIRFLGEAGIPDQLVRWISPTWI